MAGFWDFLPTLISAGAALYGASATNKANAQAANTAIATQKEATAAELAALEESKKQYAINQAAASPGLLATQETIARGSALTPEQVKAVEDSRRQALNSLQGSSLRGSARATSAIVSDTDKNVRNNFMTQNQNAANTAAQGLTSQYFGAGNNMASTTANQGQTASQGLTSTGQTAYYYSTGANKTTGNAIGTVGSLIADEVKNNLQQERSRNYTPVTSNGMYATEQEADAAAAKAGITWNKRSL